MLFLTLLGCTQLAGFGLATDPIFAVFEMDGGLAAYGQVRGVRDACAGDPTAGVEGGGTDGLCQAVQIVGSSGGGAFAGSTSQHDVLSYWFPPAPSLEALVGTTGAVTEVPCTGAEGTIDIVDRNSVATIESIDGDVAVVSFDGEVHGRVRAEICP